jgi:HKD family nuclease
MQIELIDSAWDKVLNAAVNRRESEMRIVCPFIKHRAVARLFLANHHPKIRVITRFNLADFCAAVSDTGALRILMEQGAEIRGVMGLHAKVYLFGNDQVIVTSANLTEAALCRNHEFGFISGDAAIAARCRSFFDTLWDASGPNLTDQRLSTWEKQLTAAAAKGSPPTRDTGLTDEGVDVGATTFPIELPPLVSEVEQSFVKFLGEGDNREALTLPVLEEVKRSGCHWACAYPKGKRPRIVQDGAVIFMGRLVDDGDIMIFGRAVALAHVAGRDDATAADIAFKDRGWKQWWPYYIRVHHAEFAAGTLENGVRLSHLMDQLKANAFASTQANAAIGEGNVNPRGAYRQQAAVRLSREGFDWMNARLELVFREHGKLTAEELETLDWPDVPA